MQGKRSAIGPMPETLGFNHGSASNDGSIDQQICWNTLRNPAQSRLPDYMVPSNETNVPFLSPANQERQNILGWNLGESSSSSRQNNVSRGEGKTDNGWLSAMTACPGPSHFSAEQHYGSSNNHSSNGEVNLNSQIANSILFSQGSTSSTVPHDLSRKSDLEGHDDDEDDDDDDDDDDEDCQVMECTPAFKSDGPGKERLSTASTSSDPFAGPSGSNGFLIDESDSRPGCSLDGRRMACKRKALEGHLGQSSGSGSSNYLPCAENSLWRSVPAPNNMTTGANIGVPTESSRHINFSEQVNPRLGLTVGGASMESPVALPAASRSAESFRRNFRLRINGSHQQASTPSNLFPTAGDIGNASMSSAHDSLRLLRNESLDLRSLSAADNGNPGGQPVMVQAPSLRRSAHRWDLSSSSRAGSSSGFSVFGERDPAAYEEPSTRSVPRNISQHPMFIPAADLRNLNQNPSNLTGGNISFAGNVPSGSRSGPTSGASSSSQGLVQQRNPPLYSRRLSEIMNRSLLSSARSEPGGHNGNTPPRLGSSALQEMALSGHTGHRPSSSRSAMLLERQLGGAVGVPYSWRTLAAASEGRSRLVSEIRNVLDLMRRGEGIRFEDVMLLDQSVFFGMAADIHDRHRDMRLDVDNMSYEELLALEERIGNVCTGLSEETISNRLKQRKYVCIKTEEPVDAEPCCVCQEQYNDGDDLGKLDCGHDFHTECIKQWLMQKNLCPICKTTWLNTSGKL